MIASDFSWFGWTTAAHGLDKCYTTGYDVYHSIDDPNYTYYKIGDVTMVDHKRDIAFIENTAQSTSQWNLRPSDHNEGVEILGTVSESAFLELDEEGGIAGYGVGSCFEDFRSKEWHQSVDKGFDCRNPRGDMMVVEEGFAEDVQEGDSGMLYFVEDPNNPGNWYAMGSHTGVEIINWMERAYGPQGFTIADVYDRWWAK